MKISARQSAVAMLVLLAVIELLVFATLALTGAYPLLVVVSLVAAIAQLGVLALYMRGWDGALLTTVAAITLFVALLMPEPYLTQQVALSALLPSVLALILTRPRWVVASAATVLIGLLVRAEGRGVYADPTTIIVYCAIIGGMLLARMVTDTAQRSAEESARRTEDERLRTEERAAELDAARTMLEEEVGRQRMLLELVDTLETPTVQIARGVLFAPLVGHMDSRRADALMKRLLEAVHTERARTMVIDIAGVAMVDTMVAAALVRTVQALRMLGCEVVISGISAPVAQSLVHLGASLGTVRTVRSPEEALTTLAAQN